jgi:hypothetical protein
VLLRKVKENRVVITAQIESLRANMGRPVKYDIPTLSIKRLIKKKNYRLEWIYKILESTNSNEI